MIKFIKNSPLTFLFLLILVDIIIGAIGMEYPNLDFLRLISVGLAFVLIIVLFVGFFIAIRTMLKHGV